MARAQLSIEFLIYLSIAGLSLLSCITLFKGFSSNLTNSIGTYEISEFVSKVNLLIISGISPGNFSLSLPSSICNSKVSGNSFITYFGNFSFVKSISVENGTFCHPGFSKFQLVTSANETHILMVQ